MNAKLIKEQLLIFVKSLAMGSINAIPGVSSGTVAMITGIFERIINALKSFDLTALRLLLKGNFRELIRHIDLIFILIVLFGNLIGIISFARLLEILFRYYPIYVWSYFFGLVFASVFLLGNTIKKWNVGTVVAFIAGAAIAVYILIAASGTENDSFWYLMLCGAVAICCMILPGTSGAFVLLLMGNYKLIMIEAVNYGRFEILLPFIAGAVAGLLPFSHFLSWLLKRFHALTMAVLTGFILGSLGMLWPWKISILEMLGGKEKVVGYEWYLPQMNTELTFAIVYCILGILTIYMIELLARKGIRK